MKFRSICLPVCALLVATVATAQEKAPEAKTSNEDYVVPREAFDFRLLKPDEKWKVTVALRYMPSKVSVSFGNVGIVPYDTDSSGDSGSASGLENRVYLDGYVSVDPSAPAGSNTSANWAYVGSSQAVVSGDYTGIAFHNISGAVDQQPLTVSTSGDNAYGFDMSITRQIAKLGKRWKLGLTFGAGLVDIRAQAMASAAATIEQITDTYSLNGQVVPGAPYYYATAARSSNYTPIYISGLPDRQFKTLANAADDNARVEGTWTTKGSYFLLRVGPSVEGQLSDHWRVSFGAGFIGGYLGSEFRIDEYLLSDSSIDSGGALSYHYQPANIDTRVKKFLPGYYADAQLEYYLNRTTGLFVGAAYEKVDSYDQKFGDATASVDLGAGVSYKTGIVFRF